VPSPTPAARRRHADDDASPPATPTTPMPAAARRRPRPRAARRRADSGRAPPAPPPTTPPRRRAAAADDDPGRAPTTPPAATTTRSPPPAPIPAARRPAPGRADTFSRPDGVALAIDGPLRRGHPHPRSFGTFPRLLGVYVCQMGLLSLESAVRKMTSQNGGKLGIFDRGLLRLGMYADITVFDAERVIDRSTRSK
jgi:hypothetical protein